VKKRFRARFRWSIGTGAPDGLTAQASPRAIRAPELEAAARAATMLDRGLRIILIVSAIAVFVAAALMLATMDAGTRAQGGRIYVTIAAILILAAIDGQYGRLEWRRRPLWMEGPGEVAYRRYVVSSVGLLLAAAAALIALAIYLP
jgi:hypothetical protein